MRPKEVILAPSSSGLVFCQTGVGGLGQGMFGKKQTFYEIFLAPFPHQLECQGDYPARHVLHVGSLHIKVGVTNYFS